MPRNLTPNHFDTAGIYVEGERSVFNFNKPVLSSFMSGMLVPLGDPIPVFPGVKLDLAIDAVIRSNTMVVPPLDGMYVDFFAVWVPHRIVWNHFPQFLGENDTTAWTQSATYVYPSVAHGTLNGTFSTLSSAATGFDKSVTAGNLSLADHYGLLTGQSSSGTALNSKLINVLSFRGYYSLWNYLFRDENYQRPVLFSKGDTGSSGEFGYLLRDYLIGSNTGIVSTWSTSLGTGLTSSRAILMPVNKLHDAVTSVLPESQYGNPVSLPLGTQADIVAIGRGSDAGMTFANAAPYNLGGVGIGTTKLNLTAQGSTLVSDTADASVSIYADLSTATAASINTLRTAVMYQRYLEALARGGRRMPEYYSTIYGVKNSSADCDYPKLLNRSRYMLNVNQVVATADSSGTGWTSHLGDTGAYSLTVLRNIPCCEQDFSEFGYLHIVYCVRADNRYSQFISEHFLRSSLLDEYNPFFDHIGDVSLMNYVVNNSVAATDEGAFGKQEAWWSERTQLAMATGALNKHYGSLKYWVIGEDLSSSVTVCTPGFLTFDPAVLNDIFVSAYYAYPQFIIDARIHGKKIARMSQHSIPGIVGRI